MPPEMHAMEPARIATSSDSVAFDRNGLISNCASSMPMNTLAVFDVASEPLAPMIR